MEEDDTETVVTKMEKLEQMEEGVEEPVPVEELERVQEVKRLVNSAYRYVEDQQALVPIVGQWSCMAVYVSL